MLCCAERFTDRLGEDNVLTCTIVASKCARKLESRRLGAGLLVEANLRCESRTRNPSFRRKGICNPPSTKGSELREAFLEVWDAENHKVMKVCEERHVTVEVLESNDLHFSPSLPVWGSFALLCPV